MSNIGFTIECVVCGKTLKRGTSLGISTGFLCYDCFFKCEQCLADKEKNLCEKCRLTEADKKRVAEM